MRVVVVLIINICFERDFVKLDVLMRFKLLVFIIVYEFVIMWINNKIFIWLNFFLNSEKNFIINDVRKFVFEIMELIKKR